jgi:hypothetical protein
MQFKDLSSEDWLFWLSTASIIAGVAGLAWRFAVIMKTV